MIAVVDGKTTTTEAGIDVGTSEAAITTGLAGKGVFTITTAVEGTFDGIGEPAVTKTVAENCWLYETEV